MLRPSLLSISISVCLSESVRLSVCVVCLSCLSCLLCLSCLSCMSYLSCLVISFYLSFLTHGNSLSLAISLLFCFSLIPSLSISLSISPCISLSFSLSPLLSLSLFLSASLYLSLYFSPPLSLFVSPPLSLSLSLSALSLSICHSLSCLPLMHARALHMQFCTLSSSISSCRLVPFAHKVARFHFVLCS